jgi:cytochrome P450
VGGDRRIPSHLERHYHYDGNISVGEHLQKVAVRRQECPMSYSKEFGGYWVVSTYDAIADVLRRRQTFSSYPVGLDGEGQHEVRAGKKLIPIELDGEAHQRYRALLNPLFTPAMAKQLEPSMRVLANQLIDKFIDRGKCEVVNEFARLLPGTLFLRMMGWPVEDSDMFYGWVQASMHSSPDENVTVRIQVAQEQNQYMAALISRRRRQPEDDLTTVLVNAEIDGKPISDEDLLLLFRLLMAAGLDTVQSVLGQSFVFLAQHPEFRDQMLDPAVLPTAVEELLRWASPAVPTRTALEPVGIGGIDIEEGERVHCPLGAANRDPLYYPDPDTPRLDRENPKPHLTFGLGPHRCLGSHIARLEVKVAFEEWHQRIPNYRIGSLGIGEWHLGGVWGVDSVHLEF